MRVVGRKRLYDFCRRYPDARPAVDALLAELEEATWRTSNELKAQYGSASILGKNRVVFNLRGNRYRVDVKMSYQLQETLIVRIGTHEEYDDWQF